MTNGKDSEIRPGPGTTEKKSEKEVLDGMGKGPRGRGVTVKKKKGREGNEINPPNFRRRPVN